jgi:hypothetical protein
LTVARCRRLNLSQKSNPPTDQIPSEMTVVALT